jgi:hypothetical protein
MGLKHVSGDKSANGAYGGRRKALHSRGSSDRCKELSLEKSITPRVPEAQEYLLQDAPDESHS